MSGYCGVAVCGVVYFRLFCLKMSAVGAFTVTKENIEDDRALLTKGVIGTGTEVVILLKHCLH